MRQSQQVTKETEEAPRLPSRPRRLRLLPRGGSKELGIFVLLAVLCVALSILSHGTFLHSDNLQNMARRIGMYGIFSIGLGLVIITGGIDLSVGSLFALLGVLMSLMLTDWHWLWPLALLAIIASGGLVGSWHGFLITRVNLQPFIVTLCGLLLYRGLANLIAHNDTRGFGSAKGFKTLQNLAISHPLGLPISFVLLLITAVVMGIVLHRSVYGRYLYAVGRNEEAARYSGVNAKNIIAGAYIIMGLLAAVSAVLDAFDTNSVSPSGAGTYYELYGIAAAVLGGCSLRGGEGSIIGILLGTALLQVLQNLVNLLGIDSSLNFAVMGAVILLGVITDELIKRRAANRAK